MTLPPKHQLVPCLLIISVALLLAACENQQPQSQSYFPLQENLSWRYKVTRISPVNQQEKFLTITNLGTHKINGETYHIRGTDTGNFYYLQEREDGIVRLAHRTLPQRHPQFDEPERFVIKNPVQAGTRWQHSVKPYLLHRSQQTNNVAFRRNIRYDMVWEIVGSNETVETSAGHFKQCLHIKGTGSASMQRPLSVARDEILFTTSEWYTAGVGLVKLEHQEKVVSNQTTGGKIIMDLVAFNF